MILDAKTILKRIESYIEARISFYDPHDNYDSNAIQTLNDVLSEIEEIRDELDHSNDDDYDPRYSPENDPQEVPNDIDFDDYKVVYSRKSDYSKDPYAKEEDKK